MGGLVLIGVILGLAVLVLPWISMFRVGSAERRLKEVEAKIERLFAELSAIKGTPIGEAPEAVPEVDRYWAELEAKTAPPVEIAAPAEPEEVPLLAPPSEPAPVAPAAPRPSFEQRFGVWLPVWLGGAALALAGFFLVKVSIDRGWLSPSVRVVLGAGFGAFLLYAADWMRRKDGTPNAFRIAQSLSGAGIAVLYASIFAATSLYELIPPFLGFVGLAGLTLAALVLSLRHGPPVALLGLVGGFLTPAFIRTGEPNAAGLFLYLYFLLASVLVLVRRRHWWLLGLPTIAGAFLWVLLWILGGYLKPGDNVYLGLFLLAVSATVVAATRREFESEDEGKAEDLAALFKPVYVLNALTLMGAFLLMGAVGYASGFDTMDWVFFAVLSAGGLGLAFFDQRLYGAVPWLAMGVNAAMLASWSGGTDAQYTLTMAGFGALFAVPGYLAQFRSPRPVLWAGLFSAASLGYFLLGYYELRGTELFQGYHAVWAALALALAALSTAAVTNIYKNVPDDAPVKQTLLAIFSGTATAFLCLGLFVELRREFFSVAVAAEMLALAWIGLWLEIKALRYYAALLAGVFAYLLLPQILLLGELAAMSLLDTRLYMVEAVPILRWPLFQLGLPSLFFAGTAYFLRARQDGRLIGVLEIAAIALFGIMGYHLTRQAFHPDQNVLFAGASFFERGVLTNAIFVFGLACLWGGRHFARSAVSLSGAVLSAIALFRIAYLDLVLHNPMWASQDVGEMPLVNSLVLTFGFPIFWTRLLASELGALGKERLRPYLSMAMLALAFVLVSYEVRQAFHGADLGVGATENLEVYAYSVAWLLLSLALLFVGTLRGDHAIRIASLAVMILTAGKVFLYDASQLEGLMRVLSFLGLGVSLLGISWFYTRFVFHTPAASGSGGDGAT